MSESGDYTSSSSHWHGHDFKEAYHTYDRTAGRSYADAKASGKTAKDLVPARLVTESASPLVIRCDVTGSVGEAPKLMFAKFPFMAHELRTEYLGEDAEVSFGAVGDATCDTYPIQVRPFHRLASATGVKSPADKDADIVKALKALVHEGGGGGQLTESYEIAALYDARLVDMPKAIRPIWICIGDEAPYPAVNANEAEQLCGITLERGLSTEEVFAELKRKFAAYFIQLPYSLDLGPRDGMTDHTRSVRRQWTKLLGDDHVPYLTDPARVVDVLFGILATETGKEAYFRKELEERQLPDEGGAAKVATVYKALATIHRLPKADGDAPKQLGSGRSTLHKPGSGRRGKGLLDT